MWDQAISESQILLDDAQTITETIRKDRLCWALTWSRNGLNMRGGGGKGRKDFLWGSDLEVDEQGWTKGRGASKARSEGQGGCNSRQRKVLINAKTLELVKIWRPAGLGNLRGWMAQTRWERKAEAMFILDKQGNIENHKKETWPEILLATLLNLYRTIFTHFKLFWAIHTVKHIKHT